MAGALRHPMPTGSWQLSPKTPTLQISGYAPDKVGKCKDVFDSFCANFKTFSKFAAKFLDCICKMTQKIKVTKVWQLCLCNGVLIKKFASANLTKQIHKKTQLLEKMHASYAITITSKLHLPDANFPRNNLLRIKDGKAQRPADNRLMLKTDVSAKVLHRIIELTYFLMLVRSANFIARKPPRAHPNKWT